jgi:hypothetical protein
MDTAHKLRSVARVVAALFLLSAPGPAAAEIEAWDQEKVSALATDLSEAIRAVRRSAMREPTLRDGATTARGSSQQFLDTLRQLESSTRQLATRLGKGEDLEQTLGVARRIGTLLRDAQESGRRLMLTKPTFDAIDTAVAAVHALSPFYTDQDPLMPVSTQR